MAVAMRFTVVVVAVALLSAICPCAASADAVWGTGLCFPATEPGFENYWEYCYHIYWDTTEFGGQGLSHSTIYLALAACVCACDDGYFEHRVPAGLAFGEDHAAPMELDVIAQAAGRQSGAKEPNFTRGYRIFERPSDMHRNLGKSRGIGHDLVDDLGE